MAYEDQLAGLTLPGGVTRRGRRHSVRVVLRYARVLISEFRWTLLILGAALVVGTVLHAISAPEPGAKPPSIGLSIYAAWMALFAQPFYSPPHSWYLMAVYSLYPVLGFILVGEGVVRLALLMMSRRRGEREWMMVVASTYRDHVVLCGLGHLGVRVLEQLLKAGADVVVLERSESNPFITSAKAMGAPVLIRDMKEDQALIDAGIKQAAAVLICSNDDVSNLEVAIDSRRMNSRIRVVMRLFDQQLAQKIAGALTIDAAFSSSALAAPIIAAMSLQTKVLASLMIGQVPHVVAEIRVQPASRMVGRSIFEMESTLHMRVLASQKHAGEAWIVPVGSAPVEAGEVLVVHVAAEGLSSVAAAACASRN